MVAAAGFLAELQVAPYLSPLALGADAPVAVLAAVAPVVYISGMQQAVVFAVCRDYDIFCGCSLHRLEHNLFALDSAPVVGERGAVSLERRHVHEFKTFAPFSDGGVRDDFHHGVPVDDGLLQRQVLRTVRHRVEVRHRADRGVSAGGCGAGTVPDRLLVGEARLSEMNVDVGKAVGDKAACGVDDANALPDLQVVPFPADDAVPDQDVGTAASEQNVLYH